MKYNVIVSDTAKRRLAMHIAFIVNVNKKAAKETKERIIGVFRSLGDMPERYPFLDEDLIPKNKYHKMFADNWYLVLYQVKDNTVYIDYVIDCRQDYEWLKK